MSSHHTQSFFLPSILAELLSYNPPRRLHYPALRIFAFASSLFYLHSLSFFCFLVWFCILYNTSITKDHFVVGLWFIVNVFILLRQCKIHGMRHTHEMNWAVKSCPKIVRAGFPLLLCLSSLLFMHSILHSLSSM